MERVVKVAKVEKECVQMRADSQRIFKTIYITSFNNNVSNMKNMVLYLLNNVSDEL